MDQETDMLTYKEFIELRDRLVKGEVNLEYAKAQCWGNMKKGQRSWHTKDWKERRSEFIKDKCEICNSKETLTLQHLSHPKKYSEHLTEVTRESAREYIDSRPVFDTLKFRNYILEKYDYLPVPMCPNCKSRNPNKRVRKVPQYLCIECRHEFDKTIFKSLDELISTFNETENAIEVRDKCLVTKDRRKNKHNLSTAMYWFQSEQVKSKDSENIAKKAFLLYLNDNIKYLSFEDTITACKKCASYFDLFNMELCPNCKRYYKGMLYSICLQCLPEDKRKIALEKIAFGKQMHEMHKGLGIE